MSEKVCIKGMFLSAHIHPPHHKLHILKFKLQYEWTPQQIFFCRHHVLQLFFHNVEADDAIKFSQK